MIANQDKDAICRAHAKMDQMSPGLKVRRRIPDFDSKSFDLRPQDDCLRLSRFYRNSTMLVDRRVGTPGQNCTLRAP